MEIEKALLRQMQASEATDKKIDILVEQVKVLNTSNTDLVLTVETLKTAIVALAQQVSVPVATPEATEPVDKESADEDPVKTPYKRKSR